MYDILNRFYQIIGNNSEGLFDEIKKLFEEIKNDDSKKSGFIDDLNQILPTVIHTRNINLINLVFKDTYEVIENLKNQKISNNSLLNLEVLLSNSIFLENNSIVKSTLDFIKKVYSLNGIETQKSEKYPSVFLKKIVEIYNGNDGEYLASELFSHYYGNTIENLNVVDILKDNANDLEIFNGFCDFLLQKTEIKINHSDAYNIIESINTRNTEHLNSKIKNILNLVDANGDFSKFLRNKENNSKILNIISCFNVENFEKLFGKNPQNFINFKSEYKYNILDYACSNKNYELVEYILNKKEGKEYFYNTLKNEKENYKLLNTISYFNVENFEKLFGEDLENFMNFKDESEYGILDFVCSNLYNSGNFGLLEYLLKNGANINKTKKVKGISILTPFLDFFGDILLKCKDDDTIISKNTENKISLFIETIVNSSSENKQIKLETASNIFKNINWFLMKGISALYWMCSGKIDLKNIEPICNLTINAINSLYTKNGIGKRIDNITEIQTNSVDSLKSLADSLIANINDCVSAICKEKERKIAEQEEEIQNVLNNNGNSDIEVGSSTMDKLESFIDANLGGQEINIDKKNNSQDSKKDSEEANNTKTENTIDNENIELNNNINNSSNSLKQYSCDYYSKSGSSNSSDIDWEHNYIQDHKIELPKGSNLDIENNNNKNNLQDSNNDSEKIINKVSDNESEFASSSDNEDDGVYEEPENVGVEISEDIGTKNNENINNIDFTDIRSISESNLTMNNNSNNDLDSEYTSDTQDDSENNYSLDKSSSVASEQNKNDGHCNNIQESKEELSNDSNKTSDKMEVSLVRDDLNNGVNNKENIQNPEETDKLSINSNTDEKVGNTDERMLKNNSFSSNSDNSDLSKSLPTINNSETESTTEVNENYLLKTNKKNRHNVEYIKNLASFINKKVNENLEKGENIKKYNENRKFKRKFNNIFKIFENITLPEIKINNKTVVNGGFGGEILYDKKTKKINAIRFSEDSFIMRELDNPEYEEYKYLKDIFKNGIPVWYSGISPDNYYEIFVNTLEEFKIDPYNAFKKLADISGVQLINPINYELINYNENMEKIPLFLDLIVKKRKQLEDIGKLKNEIIGKLSNKEDKKIVKNISDIAVKILTNHSFEQSVIPNSTIEGRNRLIDYIINLLGNINITGEIKNISKDTKSSLLSVFESKRILGFTRYIDENLFYNLSNINEEINNLHGNSQVL